MFELLFLLLPIAAGYGWYMGQRNVKQTLEHKSNRISREYVDGISFLLSDQHDKAVDLFLDLIKDEGDTFEAHLMLGNLFRSRGEIDRAIRIHQSLLESSSLSFEQKLLVMYQLGLDYITSGFYDRAEKIYLELMDDDDYQQSALQQLLQIYQLMKDWEKSIPIAEKLVKLGHDEYCMEIAQFYCELALKTLSGDDLEKTMVLLKKSAAANNQCARTSLMMGRVYIAQKKYHEAITSLQRIIVQDKLIVSESLLQLKECYDQIGDEQGWQTYLQCCVDKKIGALAELLLADLIDKNEGQPIAELFVAQTLKAHPSMELFFRLMNYHISEAEEGQAKESLILLRNIVDVQIKKTPHYCCLKCGFTVNTLLWYCPSCRTWATIKPNHYLEFHQLSKN